MIRERNIAVGIILSIITCGLYELYWIVCVADDINFLTRKNDMSGGMILLLGIITCGLFWLYWYYKAGDELSKMDNNGSDLGVVCLILGVVGLGIISIALLQNKLNSYAGVNVYHSIDDNNQNQGPYNGNF